MKFDRSTIKTQAKGMLKGNVLKFFLILFVVGLLTGVGSGISVGGNYNTFQQFFNKDTGQYSYSGESEDFDVENFDPEQFLEGGETPAAPAVKPQVTVSSTVSWLLALFLAPLSITLCGLFLLFIRGNNKELADGFMYVFKGTFDKNYFNKFLLCLLSGIFTFLWSLLLIIPGIVYYYKIYFATYIMAENPEMSWKEALDASKKLTDGHKGELLLLDLSFIPWYLLFLPTLGLIGIYVTPYVAVTKTLYYENFKQRALQTGAMNASDFMTTTQKLAAAGGYSAPQQGYAQPQQNYYNAPQAPAQPQQNFYTAPQAPAQPQQNYDTAPQAPAAPVQPQPNDYAAPTAPLPSQEQPPVTPNEPTE